MAIPSEWSAQKIAELLASVSSYASETSAALGAVERVAESLDAEVAAIVSGGELVAAIGYPEGAAPAAAIEAVARGAHAELTVPGAGSCSATVVALEHPPDAQLVVARSGPEPLSRDEVRLLQGMARVTSMTLRMLRLVDDERALRKESERQSAENARLLAELVDHQAQLERLAEEQAALRRVATLVAAQPAAGRVLTEVSAEVGRLLRVGITQMLAYEVDGTAAAVESWIDPSVDGEGIPVGCRLKLERDDLAGAVLRTHRATRMCSASHAEGPVADHIRRCGLQSATASPIVVEGMLWGVLIAGSPLPDLPADTEHRIEAFTQLIATALSNAKARRELERLVAEHVALRRVATLVAQGLTPQDIFSSVAAEIARISHVDTGMVFRFEADGTTTVVAKRGTADIRMAVGSNWPLDGDSVVARVFRTGRPARIEGYRDAPGPIAGTLPGPEFSSAGAPIMIGDRLWGAATATSATPPETLPVDAELRIANFADLIATAISNAEARQQLTASRARVVAAGDDARRRLERDLHDGVQQGLVALALALRSATNGIPPELPELESQLTTIGDELITALDELREISRGIHPAILSEGGIRPALNVLARRCTVPVELDVRGEDSLPERVGVATYYVVAEALTNAAKHAQASVVHVEVDVDAVERRMRLAIWDDGVGGADPGHGSGLIGIRDRVEALGGQLRITSPHNIGTSLLVILPVEAPDKEYPPASIP